LRVIILRHPQEQDRALGTAQIALLQIRNSILKTGLSYGSLNKILGRTVDPKRWGVLYLGSAKTSAFIKNQPITVISKNGEPAAEQEQLLKNLEGIILLDGNWAQAKALWWRNPWLLKCQRLILQPKRTSLYGHLRKEPRRESISTIEAAAHTIAALENNVEIAEKILIPFKKLLENAKNNQKSKPIQRVH
jgi:DTW domain-containing protein YfiP